MFSYCSFRMNILLQCKYPPAVCRALNWHWHEVLISNQCKVILYFFFDLFFSFLSLSYPSFHTHPFISLFILAKCLNKWQKFVKHHMIYCKQYSEDFWSIYTLSFRYSLMLWKSVLVWLDTKEHLPRSNSILFQINCLWSLMLVMKKFRKRLFSVGLF